MTERLLRVCLVGGCLGLWPSMARAHNCSGLSDCSAGVKIALAVLAVVLLAALIYFAMQAAAAIAARAAVMGAVAAEEAAAAAVIAGADTAVVTSAATGAAVEAGTALGVGARLGSVLRAVQAAFAASTPNSAVGALQVINQATASVGLEAGYLMGSTAGGSLVISNVGGIQTFLFTNGQILITRGSQILLHLIP